MKKSPLAIKIIGAAIALIAACSGAYSAIAATSSADTLYYSEPDKIVLPEEIAVHPTPFKGLITIDKRYDPYLLDADGSRLITLPEVLGLAIERNLDIHLSDYNVKARKWDLIGAYGRFLPNGRLGYQWQYLSGHLRLPFNAGASDAVPIRDPFIIAQAGVNYNVFQGGRILFGALQSRHRLKAARYQRNTTVNDTLMKATRRYYDLVLNEIILQIRLRAVETASAQVTRNQDLETEGLATHLDVLQAQTQLYADRQRLIDQQVARRNAAIELSSYLDLPRSTDLVPGDVTLKPVRLVAENTTPADLLNIAMKTRPELKDFLEQHKAAKNQIVIAGANAWPTVQLSATEFGIGQTLTDKKETIVTQGPDGNLMVNRRSRQISGLSSIGFNVNWNLTGLGVPDMAASMAAKQEARHALVQLNKQVNSVTDQVRQGFLRSLANERKLEETRSRMISTAEQLRLAQIRSQHGLGINLDVMQAQQDYTNALVEHARATVDFNLAQAQMLHDSGIISRQTLTSAQALRPAP